MKKLIAFFLMLTMCLSLAACANEEPEVEKEPEVQPEAVSDLESAAAYLDAMYRKAPATHMEDFQVVGKVKVGGTTFDVDWAADSDTVKFIPDDKGMVTVDVNEKNPEEVIFNLTATLTDAEGKTASVSFQHKVPAALIVEGLSYEEIVAAAYKLDEGMAMTDEMRLFGKVVKINSEYSEQYKNCTLTIQIGELADQPIECFRLAGEGVENVKEGDMITVKGMLKNYKGKIEFDKGCQYLGQGEHIDQSAVINAAYKLDEGMAMPNPAVLKGVITAVNSEFNPKYNNVTVTIVVDGLTEQPIECFRLAGEGADTIKVDDEIAVVGTLKNYKGKIEFDQGCKLVAADAFMDVRTAVAAYALEDGTAMTAASTMTGVIVSVDSEYSAEYKNVTVTIVAGGAEDYKVQCFRLSGEGADKIKVGDVITVTGTLKNYKGTIEFDKGCTLDAVREA